MKITKSQLEKIIKEEISYAANDDAVVIKEELNEELPGWARRPKEREAARASEMEKQLPSYVKAKKIYDNYVNLRRHIEFKNEESTRLYYELQKDIENLQHELWSQSGNNP